MYDLRIGRFQIALSERNAFADDLLTFIEGEYFCILLCEGQNLVLGIISS